MRPTSTVTYLYSATCYYKVTAFKLSYFQTSEKLVQQPALVKQLHKVPLNVLTLREHRMFL